MQQCPLRCERRKLGHLEKSLSGTASDAESITAMVGCPTVILTLGLSTDGDLTVYYYNHHIGDYLSHTAHLTLLEHGVYLRLLQVYYRYEKPLLESEAPRQVGAKAPDEVQAVQRILNEYFISTPQGFTHKRADEELAKYREKSGKAKDAANARWSNGMRTHSGRNADAMLTNNQYPKTNISNLTSNETSPLLISSISNIEVDDANALQTHSERIADASREAIATLKPSYNPPIATPLPPHDQGKAWAYRLKEREEAGEVLTLAQKRNWREALRVKA